MFWCAFRICVRAGGRDPPVCWVRAADHALSRVPQMGDEGVGKTELFRVGVAGGVFGGTYRPTIGADFATKEVRDATRAMLRLHAHGHYRHGSRVAAGESAPRQCLLRRESPHMCVLYLWARVGPASARATCFFSL